MMHHDRQFTRSECDQALQKHQLWLETCGTKGARADLQWADLRCVDLRGVDLWCADLQRVDLRGADLRGADLRGVDLLGADLREVDLREADLRHADLVCADLRGVQLGISIRDCYSFCNAKFTADALPWLILHPRWVKLQHLVQIEEVAA